MIETLPLQSVPEIFGPPFDRILFILVLLAGLLLASRIVLNVAWKLVLAGVLVVAVIGAASVLGFL